MAPQTPSTPTAPAPVSTPGPLTTSAPAPTATRFDAIGTTNRILVTDPAALIEATAVAKEHLAALDAAVSRFRDDSEVSALAARAAFGPAWCFGSPTFTDYLRDGLRAARLTDGLVDPTIGAAMVASGYDADMDAVRSRPTPTTPRPASAAIIPGWRQVQVSDTGRTEVPAGTLIDLGATAKAAAADRIAALLARRLPGGFLVNLGGDVATSGALPDGGWRIGVEAADGTILQVVTGIGQAFATSSTQKRTWATSEAATPTRHHIVDPRTGTTAITPWAQVTCAAATALEANAASTAAIILGADAPAWLASHGIPARLDGLDGAVTTTPGWPQEQS
ncbi:MAG: FAD:protein FMN transferase [Dermatophilaceae bacterium]